MAESQAAKNWYWNSRSGRWEVRGRGKGEPIMYLAEAGPGIPDGKTLTFGAQAVSAFKKHTGTIALSAIVTNTVGVATVTGLSGIAVGDLVFVVPKSAIAGKTLGQAVVATTNTVNVYVNNPNISSAGSLAAVGVDVFQVRLS